MPLRNFKLSFSLPFLVKHIRDLLSCQHGSVKPNEDTILEGNKGVMELDKNLRFSKQFFPIYELGEEVGRGHFGYTCLANTKKRDIKREEVAVKIIPKSRTLGKQLQLFDIRLRQT